MAVPPPISAREVLTAWHVDLVTLVLVVAAAGLYLGGVQRLRRRDRHWSALRIAAFGGGLATIVFATMSGLAAYENVLFSAHAVQHLLLGMAAPILLALSAPVTLALQASSRPTQVSLLRVLHSPVVRTITHPAFALALFGGSLFVLYFTGLYELSLRNDVIHAWLHLHFIVSGALFFWVIVGLDPVGWPLPYWARLLLVLVVVPAHAFLGMALVSSDQLIAADWYLDLGRTWGASPLDDQQTGGALLWAVGDLLALVGAGLVLVRWAHDDEIESRRLDRRLRVTGIDVPTLPPRKVTP